MQHHQFAYSVEDGLVFTAFMALIERCRTSHGRPKASLPGKSIRKGDAAGDSKLWIQLLKSSRLSVAYRWADSNRTEHSDWTEIARAESSQRPSNQQPGAWIPRGPELSVTVVSIYYKSPSPFPRLNSDGGLCVGARYKPREYQQLTTRVTNSTLTRMSTPRVTFSGKLGRIS